MHTDTPITDAAVAAALERLAESHQRSADGAAGDTRRFFRRWAGSFRKALYFWLAGVRPVAIPGGGWLVASATRGGVVHSVSKDGGCICAAHGTGCWHAALACGIEVGYEDLDNEPEPEPIAPQPRDLGRRIAVAQATRFADMQTW